MAMWAAGPPKAVQPRMNHCLMSSRQVASTMRSRLFLSSSCCCCCSMSVEEGGDGGLEVSWWAGGDDWEMCSFTPLVDPFCGFSMLIDYL